MIMNKIILFCISLSLFIFSLSVLDHKNNKQFISKPNDQAIKQEEPLEFPKITNECPSHLSYSETVEQLKTWEKEAKHFVKVFNYGMSSKGSELCCALITNTKSKTEKDKVMVTACIHGNEPWSSGTLMAFIGNLLKTYESDSEVKKTLDEKEIYFVPVVSPDSYPFDRYVDGVDPNRNFPKDGNSNKISVKPVRELQKLFLKIQPKVAISGHTFGRSFLYPYADTDSLCENDNDYKIILRKMQELSGYSALKTSKNYGYPIFGTEVDYYYRNGCMSLVVEFGTHQIKPTLEQIKSEHSKTKLALLHFINAGCKVVVKKNASISETIEKPNSLNINILETGP